MRRMLGTAVTVLLLASMASASASTTSHRWRVVPSPNPGSFSDSLQDVVRFSATDAWAVGSWSNHLWWPYRALVEHWDGASWQAVPTPRRPAPSAGLCAVAASSPSDIWAVGGQGGKGWNHPHAKTLIEHYDGSSWSVVPSPSPGPIASLTSVSVSAPHDAWAVGGVTDVGYTKLEPLVLHWDGMSWQVVPTPDTGSPYTYLNDVEQTSSTDAWIVGSYWVPEASRAFAEHWDGTRWRITRIPKVGYQDELNSVDALAPDDVWAVGGSPSDPTDSITEHWDGTAWTFVPVPKPANGIVLRSVSAVSPTDVWAVGDYGLRIAKTAFEHWDGSAWTMRPAPPAPKGWGELVAIAAGANGAFAVGDFAPNVYKNRTRTLVAACCG